MYDTCYRCKAALMKSLNWSQVDFTLYNETFAERARALVHCKHCLSEHRTSTSCTVAPEPSPTLQPPVIRNSKAPKEICRLFNTKQGDRCRYSPCWFIHVCLECQGRHLAAACPRANPPPAKVSKPAFLQAWYRR